MPYITLNVKKLQHNYSFLDNLFRENGIEWSIVTKLLCGNKNYIAEVLKLGIKQVCDSRLVNLKVIKSLNPKVETILIKPPPRRSLSNIVKYADITLNTERTTIKLLSEEAQKQNKIHKIIIMLELGELREGVMHDDFVKFYEFAINQKNIEVVGIGANFTCLYGVLPSYDKLMQLCLYKQILETKFNKKIKYLSGGSSVVIPFILINLLPKEINHFRVGETLFFGTDIYNNSVIEGMSTDVFTLYSEILELKKKPNQPYGELGTNLEGISFDFDNTIPVEESYRAILDFGIIDTDKEHIQFLDPEIKIVGISSDMTVVNIGNNPNKYKVGDFIEIKLDYISALKILHSKYVEKIVNL